MITSLRSPVRGALPFVATAPQLLRNNAPDLAPIASIAANPPALPLASNSPLPQALSLLQSRFAEPGVWKITNEGAVAEAGQHCGTTPKFSKPTMVLLRSLHSNERTRVKFANESTTAVTAFWLNYSGQELPYGTLLPGQAKVYETYVSHPWMFRCSVTGNRMVVDGRMAYYAEEMVAPPGKGLGLLSLSNTCPSLRLQPKRVTITMPLPLEHSPETHCAFPTDFKVASRALLLAHKRLQRPDQQVKAASAADAEENEQTTAEAKGRMIRTAECSDCFVSAQPAMQVCESSNDSTNTDSTKSCWLNGAALLSADTEQGTGATSSCKSRCTAEVWGPIPVQLTQALATTISAAAAEARETQAPDQEYMRVTHLHTQVIQGVGYAGASPVAATTLLASLQTAAGGEASQPERTEAGPSSRPQLPARSEDQIKARAAMEAEKSAAQLGRLLAELPHDLVTHIVHLMAPPLTQDINLHPRGCPDIQPALLPCDPATWVPLPAVEAAN